MSRYPNPLYDLFAAELNLQLKPLETDIKIIPNLLCGAIAYQYSEYEVSIDSKVFYLGFTKSSVSTVELKLELKPQANNIRISPTLIYDVFPPPID